MGGFFGAISKQDCVLDIFFGVDYHSHLGTRRGGMAIYDEASGGFQRQIMELAHLVDLQMSDQDAAVDADDLEYMYLFAVSGALGMLSHWLKKGTPQSPAEMSELLMSMIQHGVEERA